VKAKTNTNQERTEATIGCGLEEMRFAMSSIWAEMEKSMKHRVDDVLVSLDHRTRGTQAEIGTTKTLVDTAQLGLDAKVVEVTDDFFLGLETGRREFKIPLVEVEARDAHEFSEYSTTETLAECGSYQRTEIGIKWSSILDLKSGYWQIDLHPDEKKKTAFSTGHGLW
jgi:hypothetical protein